MAQNTMNNNVVVAMSKEEIEAKTKAQIREMLETVGVELSNTEFKKTKKAELVAMMEQYLDPTHRVKIVAEELEEMGYDPDIALEYAYDECLGEEEEKDTKSKWDKIILAMEKELVVQSVTKANKYGLPVQKHPLCFHPTRSTIVDRDMYMIQGKRLYAVAYKTIRVLYGERYETKDNVLSLLNEMEDRHLISTKQVQGNRGTVTVYATTQASMVAMLNDVM